MLYLNDQGKMFIIPNTTFLCVLLILYMTCQLHVKSVANTTLLCVLLILMTCLLHVNSVCGCYSDGMGDNHVIIRVEGRVVCRLNIYFHVLLHMMFFRHNYSLHLCCGISIFILSRARLFISVLSKPDIHL